jgi:hypothetical protein
MAKVKYITKAKRTWTKHKRQLIRDAFKHAFWEMNLYKLDVHIDIRLVGTPNAPGACTDAETKYVVHIDGTQDQEDIAETLFHELQHVIQYALGYLQDAESKVYWLGNWYTGDYQDTTTSDYWDAPWEVEARQVAWNVSENYYQN